jgi:hypothetical protein
MNFLFKDAHMRLRYLFVGTGLCAAAILSRAAPQASSDGDNRAPEYVQFLVLQLDQWTRDLPQAYDMALMHPPVDVSSVSEEERAGAGALRNHMQRLAALSQVKDLLVNQEFRTQLEKTVQAAAPVNAALAKQRFPDGIEADWAQIRTTLNSLAAIYKYPELAVLSVPGQASGRGGQAAAISAGAITGYVVDQRCADMGKPMWTNVACVRKCVRDGDKLVFVSEQGKVFQFANQDKIEPGSYGQKVAVTGKTDGDIITVAALQIL